MPLLKNAALAIIDPRKFTAYCLNHMSEDGRHKARVFKTALGYDLSNHHELIDAIRKGILKASAEYVREQPGGTMWRVDLEIVGPAGAAIVRTGWFYDRGSDVPRLTTAFVR